MNQAYLACAELLYRGRVTDRETQFALIDSIEPGELQAAARRYLHPEEIRAALVGPPTLDVEEILSAGAATAA
jgi:hypothetical protein